jgi:hypothetical protein
MPQVPTGRIIADGKAVLRCEKSRFFASRLPPTSANAALSVKTDDQNHHKPARPQSHRGFWDVLCAGHCKRKMDTVDATLVCDRHLLVPRSLISQSRHKLGIPHALYTMGGVCLRLGWMVIALEGCLHKQSAFHFFTKPHPRKNNATLC